MAISIPSELRNRIQALLDTLPPDDAMTSLVVERPRDGKLTEIVSNLLKSNVVPAQSPLASGLWLYVDELDRSHRISQSIDNETGSFWHGIMHRREGDFSNSHYWFRRVGTHPAITAIDDYDPHDLIDRVEAAHKRGEQPEALIELQRREWITLFGWCARNVDV